MKRLLMMVTFYALLGLLLLLLRVSMEKQNLKIPRAMLNYGGRGYLKELILSKSCSNWLRELGNAPIPALLIDHHILRQLYINNCSHVEINVSIKIGISESYRWKSGSWDKKFEVFYYSNHTEKDYLTFTMDRKKLIPKDFPSIQIGNLIIPSNIPVFLEFWRRSTFVECRNMTMKNTRDPPKFRHFPFLQKFILKDPKIPAKESVNHLSKLRDEMLKFGVFPFLNGGTLLGWYRECTVIPHTTDMDLAIFAENWNPEFLEFLWSRESMFRVKRQLGMVNDSYEITVIPKYGFRTPIDIFLMYKGNDGSENRWVGGTAVDGSKYKYMYPPYDPVCTADLLGHLFWVTCTPNDKIRKEYGNYWYLDRNSLKYVWNAARNVIPNGRFTKDQMETTVYNEYRDVFLIINNSE